MLTSGSDGPARPPSQFPSPPKFYFLRFVLHGWLEDNCVETLKNIRAVIRSSEDGGRLYIAEIPLNKDSGRFKSTHYDENKRRVGENGRGVYGDPREERVQDRESTWEQVVRFFG